ncbi:MAG: DUF1194 domain-containing protein [Alphaproteobacteria bacterium]|nr:DUF1194 domain-containing protein [Alphaproteobacteria bacterium]
MRIRGLVVLLALSLTGAGVRAAERVDVVLVLAADVSRSVDEEEFRLQRDGIATALTDPRVLNAIRSGLHRAIAVSFVEWSGVGQQLVVADWAVVRDLASAQAVARIVRSAPRSYYGSTAIGSAIDFSMRQLARAKFEAERQVIDVSGDGTNVSGPSVAAARDAAVEAGIAINGLAILSAVPNPFNPDHTHPPGGLEEYYRKNVTGGVGSFVIVVEGFQTFADAMINKLIREIAALP